MTIPTLTKDWMENALSEKIEHFDVSPGCNTGDGYLSVLYSIVVHYPNNEEEEKEKPPGQLMLKTFPLNPGLQEMLTKNNIFHKELLVYNQVIPEMLKFQEESCCKSVEIVPLPFPTFIYGKSVDYRQKSAKREGIVDPLANCILMNDLRKDGEFRIANRLVGLDFEHCGLVIEALAKVHAVSWSYKQQVLQTDRILSKFPFLVNTPLDDMADPIVLGLFDAQIGTFCRAIQGHYHLAKEGQLKSDLLSSLSRFQDIAMDVLALYFSDSRLVSNSTVTKDNILRVPQHAQEDEKPWLVLTHGDSWLNNQMFRYDDCGKPVEVKLVDLQMVREGDPMCDIVYSIYTSTTAAVRKTHLKEILQIYHSTFIRVCQQIGVDPLPGFTLMEVGRRFHRAKIFGFLMSIILLPIILNETSRDLEDKKEVDTEGHFLQEMTSSPVEEQSMFRERAIDLVRELREEGVI